MNEQFLQRSKSISKKSEQNHEPPSYYYKARLLQARCVLLQKPLTSGRGHLDLLVASLLNYEGLLIKREELSTQGPTMPGRTHT